MSTLSDLMAAAPSTEILVDGYRLQANNQGYYGTIRFWFAGEDLFNFTSTVAGKPQTLTIAGSGGLGIAITRLIPLVHPYITGGNCYADDIDVYPPPGAIATLDASGTGIAFADYFADVHFSTPNYSMELGDFPTLTITLQGGEDRVTRPGSSYLFPSDSMRMNHDVGVPVKKIAYGITCHKLPSLDTTLYESLVGCVNSTTFLNKPPGTVLYNGPSCQGQFVVAGLPTFDCTHEVEYRSIPHNQIMRPDGAGFEAPIESGGETVDGATEGSTTDPVYMMPEGDLNQLLGM